MEVPLRSEKLAELIARQIVEDVLRDGLEPGTRLPPERQMVARFKVGRATLREALRILEVHGLLTMKAGPTGGPYVREMTAQNLARIASLHYKVAGAKVGHVWEARAMVEPMMARRVAEMCSEAVKTELTDLLEESKDLDPDDEAGHIRIGSAFHKVIASRSGNPLLDLFARSLGDVTSFLATRAVFPKEARNHVMHDHQAIAAAIMAGDADQAERLMKLHMQDMLASQTGRDPEALGAPIPYIL
ncbi:MAG: GntR family transcriptional regulator, transcriptional repressor for pyruvate dehydrogenase complex [Acidimicrobiaceae bacterium]|jgi:DNA-binding FadR family transcriptional regulator|nr:GntR family transcriptional regulator, transcriptional repressor for pyruvate dehydrogenase complex [Acidimicrobiaceae bacterium]